MKRNETHCKMILAYWEDHEFITADTAIELFHCYRLAARIHDLRKLGIDIETEMVFTLDDDGLPMKYAKYRKVS